MFLYLEFNDSIGGPVKYPLVVLVFDVDGTLEVGSPPGPIPIRVLYELKRRGFIVGIIGNYHRIIHRCIDFHFCLQGHPVKHISLRRVIEMFNPDLVIYVADEDRDRRACMDAGVVYVRPEHFSYFIKNLFV